MQLAKNTLEEVERQLKTLSTRDTAGPAWLLATPYRMESRMYDPADDDQLKLRPSRLGYP